MSPRPLPAFHPLVTSGVQIDPLTINRKMLPGLFRAPHNTSGAPPVPVSYPVGQHYRGGPCGPDVNLPVPTDELNNPNFKGCIDRKA